MVLLPCVGSLPDQAPLALQELALALLQLSVAEPPETTLLTLLDRLRVGAGVAACTVTTVFVVAVPPLPLSQVST